MFKNETTDLRQANVTATPYRYDVSPGYFDAAGTRLLAGRDFSWHADKRAPVVAVVNKELAGRIFGSMRKAVGGNRKLQNGTSVPVVGVVEDGKYYALTEDQQPATFLAFQQSGLSYASAINLLVRSHRDPQQLSAAIRNKLYELKSGLPVDSQTWNVYQPTTRDPLVLGGVFAALALLGLLATWIPALRALSLDPVKLLREQ